VAVDMETCLLPLHSLSLLAAIRFVLDNPNVNTVCCSLKTYDEMERIHPLSGSKLSDWDKAKLAA
jgi:hypothetical protein